jgi:hypothetical protein
MASLTRPVDKKPLEESRDPSKHGRLKLEWDSFFSNLLTAVNAVSQGSLVATQSFTVLTMPDPAEAGAGRIIYVSNAAGGAIPAFSDGTDWRRVDTRAIVT